MKILLVQPAIGIDVPIYNGLAHVSAALRVAGHDTALLKIARPVGRREFLKVVSNYAPQIVGFTCVTHHWPYVAQWAAWIKDHTPDLPIIIGGPHATINADSIQKCPSMDAIVVGEGERSVVDLVAAYEKGQERVGIPGTIVRAKEDRRWIAGGVAAFLEDLDALPFADRTIYGPRQYGDLHMLAGRGCPHNCAYCCNHLFKKAQTGPYVRMRSPEHILREIKECRAEQKINRVAFNDDTFTLIKPWLMDFLPRYRDSIGLPFVANAHVKHFDREMAVALKDAGCVQLKFGIESGSEAIRRDIMKRFMTNEEIVQAVTTAKDAGLEVFALYMIGLPTETAEMARETLALHQRLGIGVAMITVFYPYPGTQLWSLCEKMGLLSEKDKAGYQEASSTLNGLAMSHEDLFSLYHEFEDMRLTSSFVDQYVLANYPWARLPISILSRLFGKKRVVEFAMAARSRLKPAMALHRSTYPTANAPSLKTL